MRAKPPEKYINSAADKKALALGYYWSNAWVARALKFCALLCDPRNPRKRLTLLSWQREIIEQIYGWRRADTTRRFTRLGLWVPKKNGKSFFLAVLNLLGLFIDGESDPGCYVISATGEQSRQLYDDCCKLLKNSPLAKLIRYQNHRARLTRIDQPGQFRCLAANAKGAEGIRGSRITLDEIHALLAKKSDIYGAVKYAGIDRKSPLFATISTAGDNRGSLAYKIYRDDKEIATGAREDLSALSKIWEAEDKENYTPEELAAANPSTGEIFNIDRLVEDYEIAKQDPGTLAMFKRYRLNVWTSSITAWLNMTDWDGCYLPRESWEDLTGCRAYIGVDLAATTDLAAAFALIEAPSGKLYFDSHFWLPAKDIARRSKIETDYISANKAGYITLCNTPEIDQKLLVGWVLDRAQKYDLRGVGVDPWRALEIDTELTNAGLETTRVPQNWGLSPAAIRFETMLKTRAACHDGNTILTWCVNNVHKTTNSRGMIRPDKGADQKMKIDGVMAGVIATRLKQDLEAEPLDQTPAPYFG